MSHNLSFIDVLKLISCMNDEDLGDAYKLAEKRRYERNLIRKVYYSIII